MRVEMGRHAWRGARAYDTPTTFPLNFIDAALERYSIVIDG